jgi:hypothetical protein
MKKRIYIVLALVIAAVMALSATFPALAETTLGKGNTTWWSNQLLEEARRVGGQVVQPPHLDENGNLDLVTVTLNNGRTEQRLATQPNHYSRRTNSSGEDKISSNAHSARLPWMYFNWNERQRDDGLLLVHQNMFASFRDNSFILTTQNANTYFDFPIIREGATQILTGADGGNVYIFKIPRQLQILHSNGQPRQMEQKNINNVFIDGNWRAFTVNVEKEWLDSNGSITGQPVGATIRDVSFTNGFRLGARTIRLGHEDYARVNFSENEVPRHELRGVTINGTSQTITGEDHVDFKAKDDTTYNIIFTNQNTDATVSVETVWLDNNPESLEVSYNVVGYGVGEEPITHGGLDQENFTMFDPVPAGSEFSVQQIEVPDSYYLLKAFVNGERIPKGVDVINVAPQANGRHEVVFILKPGFVEYSYEVELIDLYGEEVENPEDFFAGTYEELVDLMSSNTSIFQRDHGETDNQGVLAAIGEFFADLWGQFRLLIGLETTVNVGEPVSWPVPPVYHGIEIVFDSIYIEKTYVGNGHYVEEIAREFTPEEGWHYSIVFVYRMVKLPVDPGNDPGDSTDRNGFPFIPNRQRFDEFFNAGFDILAVGASNQQAHRHVVAFDCSRYQQITLGYGAGGNIEHVLVLTNDGIKELNGEYVIAPTIVRLADKCGVSLGFNQGHIGNWHGFQLRFPDWKVFVFDTPWNSSGAGQIFLLDVVLVEDNPNEKVLGDTDNTLLINSNNVNNITITEIEEEARETVEAVETVE